MVVSRIKKGGTPTYVTPTTPSLRLVGDLALGSSPLPEVDGSTVVLPEGVVSKLLIVLRVDGTHQSYLLVLSSKRADHVHGYHPVLCH